MSLQVLLVDDDNMVIYLHKMLTRMSGLADEPLCFGEGKSALEYLSARYQEGTHYLVLLDINMPVMNGWEFLQAVQTTDFAGALSVVMVTSSIEQEDRDQARQFKQVVNFMEKPLNVETCKQILHLPELSNRIGKGTRPISPSL
jgi:CheY-like chemotaxis protein